MDTSPHTYVSSSFESVNPQTVIQNLLEDTTNITVNAIEANTVNDKIPTIVDKKEAGRLKRLANLRPAKKGEIRNPTGKKGIRIKEVMTKRLKREQALQIVDSIISGSIAGDDKKQDRLLKLTDDFNDTPQVNINNNTAHFHQGLLEAAKELIKQRQSQNIIDITPSTMLLSNIDNEISSSQN